MKWIRYKLADGLTEKGMTYTERNLEIALSESYEGQYSIVDDGAPEVVEAPSHWDMIEAQLAYTAMMTDTLLEV